MIDLYLHAGFGKTGSTYIQSLLKSNTELLHNHGILYPTNSTIHDSGNGHLLYNDYFLESVISPDNSYSRVLFSREHFTRELAGEQHSQFFTNLVQSQSIGNIYVLLFVRNAFDHCYSLWSQKIKNTTESRSFHEFAKCYDSLYIASSFITNVLDMGLNLKVVNYSTTTSLESVFFRWLDPSLNPLNLSLPPAPINVSPNYSCLNRIRLYRRLSNDRSNLSFLHVFLIYFLCLPIFKPRRSVFYAFMWRFQISQLNHILSHQSIVAHNGFCKVLY